MNEDERYRGLKKAYASQLHIEKCDGKEVIIKQVDAREAQSELFFHVQLKSIGLPSMEIKLHKEGLAVTFIPDAQTLGDDETSELYERLGVALRKLHNTTFDKPFFIDANRAIREVMWRKFIESRFKFAATRQKECNGLEGDMVDQCKNILVEKTSSFSGRPCLLHGDLHSNNVLVKGSDLFIFDKADQIMAGDPMYDLSLFAITLSGAVYGIGNTVAKDEILLSAFIKGYGYNFTTDRDVLDAYVLLRCLERWPTPFEEEIPQIVNSILSKNTDE